MKPAQTITVIALTWVSLSQQAVGELNRMCPVLQDREASSEYVANHKGTEVAFCCSECVVEFQRNPEIYENVIPQLQSVPVRTQISNFMGRYGGVLLGGALFLTLVGIRVYRVTRSSSDCDASSWLNKWISPVVPLVILTGYLGFEVYTLQGQLLDEKLEDEVHFATFYDFGYPPVPSRPETTAQLHGSYYRGNDERSPKLFNNGNYRTATFHIELCDVDGTPVIAGDDIRNRQLFVKFLIERPPFTQDFMYNEELMGTMFLTRECDRFLGKDSAVQDAVGLTMVEPMQKWEAMFPLPQDGLCCGGSSRGTVYVCEAYYYQPQISLLKKRRGGSRFHYGIRYELSAIDGVLQLESDLYMGALYRTRKLPTWRVPMSQWFSHEPIPELTGENVDDPELLGIDEHLSKQQ